jgi:hypothetical protein
VPDINEHLAASNGPWREKGYGWLCSCGEWEFTGWNRTDADVGAKEHMNKAGDLSA